MKNYDKFIRWLIIVLLLSALIYGLASCNPQKQLERLQARSLAVVEAYPDGMNTIGAIYLKAHPIICDTPSVRYLPGHIDTVPFPILLEDTAARNRLFGEDERLRSAFDSGYNRAVSAYSGLIQPSRAPDTIIYKVQDVLSLNNALDSLQWYKLAHLKEQTNTANQATLTAETHTTAISRLWLFIASCALNVILIYLLIKK